MPEIMIMITIITQSDNSALTKTFKLNSSMNVNCGILKQEKFFNKMTAKSILYIHTHINVIVHE